MVILMKGMTCIKCRRKVAKVFAIFVTREIIKETEEITLKALQDTFYSLWSLLYPCMNNISNNNL